MSTTHPADMNERNGRTHGMSEREISVDLDIVERIA